MKTFDVVFYVLDIFCVVLRRRFYILEFFTLLIQMPFCGCYFVGEVLGDLSRCEAWPGDEVVVFTACKNWR